MISISPSTINAGRSTFNIAGGNQVNQTNYHIYPSSAIDNTIRHPVNNAPVVLLSVHFTGRGNELEFLETALSKFHSGVANCCAVHGMPGIGKTQLLLRYVKLSWDSHRYSCIFWISATSVDKINQGFSGILDLIEHPDRYLQDQTAKLNAARVWLEKYEGGDWLLIFDNVHRETLNFLRVHLPLANGRGNILFSTRTADVAESLVNAGGEQHSRLGLQAMDLRETANLLFEDAGIDVGTATPPMLDQAEDLVKRVGRLPLAVVQLASFMKQTHTSINDMLELYKKKRKIEVIRWENDLTTYEARSVAETFASQFNEVNQQSRNIGNLLKLLSFLDPENIPVEMIVHGAETQLQLPPQHKHTIIQKSKGWRARKNGHTKSDADNITTPSRISLELNSLLSLIVSPIEFQTAIQKLQNLSLVEHRSHNGISSLWIHDLIRFMVQEDVKKEGTYEEWLRSSWSLVYDIFRLVADPMLPQSWADCEKFIPHLQSLKDALNDAKGTNIEVAQANSQVAEYFRSRGRYGEAESLSKQALEVNEKQLGVDHPETLTSVNDLALVYALQRRHDEAVGLRKRALEGRKKRLGADHPATLMSMGKLALLYSFQSRYDEAEVLHKRALEGKERLLGIDHPDTLTSAGDLASCYWSQGRNDEAEILYKRSLEGREKCLGPDHPYTLVSANNLALVYSSQGRYCEAEALHKRVLENFETLLGTDHPNTLILMSNLALVYSSQGRYDEAGALHKRALEEKEKLLGANHPDTFTSVNNLALVYSWQGRYNEAEGLHKRALQGREMHLGIDHPDTLTSANNLALDYSSQGRYDEAEALYKRTLEGWETQLKANHPDTTMSTKDLAQVYLSQRRFDEAEVLRRRALERR